MGTNRVVLLAILSAFWIWGLLNQLHSIKTTMVYLGISAVFAAASLFWRLKSKTPR